MRRDYNEHVDRDIVAGLLAQLAPSVLRILNDAQLAALVDWSDPVCVAVARGESARRDMADRSRVRAAPMPAPVPRAPRAVRVAEDQRIAVHAAYVAAEDACRGHMLSRHGRAAGVDPYSLFTGPEPRARRYASEELCEWWDQHGRPTAADWRRDAARERVAVENFDYMRRGVSV